MLLLIDVYCQQIKFTEVFPWFSGTSPHVVSSVNVTTELHQANVSWVPGFDGGFTQKFTVWSVTHKIRHIYQPPTGNVTCELIFSSFVGSNKHPGGNTNGRRCQCRRPKTTCLSPGCLLALATSLASYLRINSARDLLVKLYQCEQKVCVRTRVLLHMFILTSFCS